MGVGTLSGTTLANERDEAELRSVRRTRGICLMDEFTKTGPVAALCE